jgi:hypothetical protein
MRRNLDRRYDAICKGGEEATVFLSRKNGVLSEPGRQKPAEPAVKPGALWEPVPITMPTYVSKPLAPRTVRTIDLSGPVVTPTSRPTIPVTADAPPSKSPAAAQDQGDEMPEAASA